MSLQYGELRPIAAEIGPVVWGTPANFNGFRVLAALLHGQSINHKVGYTISGRQQNFAALNRGRHLFGRAAITLVIGPHFSYR